jgi:hypothetical protein
MPRKHGGGGEGVEVQLYRFFNLDACWGGVGGQRPAPAALPVGFGKFRPQSFRTPDPPAPSEWLY